MSMEQIMNPHERAEIPQRFTDTLGVEQEACWDVLVRLSMSQSGTLDEVMTSIWSNDTLPLVFRDRAMLLVIGAGVERNETIEGLEPQAFSSWVKDAWQYQFRTGVDLMETKDYQRWYKGFFDQGLIDEASYDVFTRQAAIASIRPGSSGSVYRRAIAECEVY